MIQTLADWSPRVLSILRVITALLFTEHGLMKLFQFPGPQPGVIGALPTLLLVAACIEVVGGALIALGLLTRPAALICSGEMAVAYFTGHASKGFWPGLNGGDAAILFCFVFLYMIFAGPGVWSLDMLRAHQGGVSVRV